MNIWPTQWPRGREMGQKNRPHGPSRPKGVSLLSQSGTVRNVPLSQKGNSMITFTCKTASIDDKLRLMGLEPEDCVFFDIETTGFRASTSHLYMIGAACRRGGEWVVTQWMGERPQEEAGLLRVFSEFVRPYGTLIHFNGARFDLPYVAEKYEKYGLDSPLPQMRSVDIYRDCKCLKSLFGLSHMNQKSLERFLGLDREDQYDGGQLIKVYYDYVKTGDKDLEKLLLLHNCEDVKGMLLLTSLYTYLDLLSAQPSEATCNTLDAQLQDGNLKIRIELPYEVPVPVSLSASAFNLSINGKTAELTAAVYTGELLYFFDNYKDYYYLPVEDTAIHKSVAGFLDSKYRENAKPRNCYTKASGRFLPQPDPIITPAYKTSYEDTIYWLQMPEEIENSQDFLHSYAALLIRSFRP